MGLEQTKSRNRNGGKHTACEFSSITPNSYSCHLRQISFSVAKDGNLLSVSLILCSQTLNSFDVSRSTALPCSFTSIINSTGLLTRADAGSKNMRPHLVTPLLTR